MYKESACYAVYIEGPVRYSGRNRAMVNLSSGLHQFFRSFIEMKRFLKSLPSGAAVPEPASGPDMEEYDLGSIASVDELSLLQQATTAIPDYKTVQREMERHIIGQEKAVETIAHQAALHLSKSRPRKPLSFIMYGPSGIGKSEAAKALPKVLSRLGPHNFATVWTELNTFTEAHSVYRLTGSPPGYVGYDDAPIFEAAINNPHTIFIFDELDKAHPEVLKTFMSILDEGRCAARKELENQSREYDFHHCIFIFTSNFRLTDQAKNKVGFAAGDEIESINHEGEAVAVSYQGDMPAEGFGAVTKRIFRDTEAARKAFVEIGVLREIASRFNCFVEFQELSDKAKMQILAKQVIETGFEYGIRLTYIASAILQELINASMTGEALTVRSFKSVIEGYLSAAFAEAGAHSQGQTVRLEGTLETPSFVNAQESLSIS